MSKLNTNSNGYTIGFLVLMVVIVGGALAFVSAVMKPTIDANIELDTKSKILKSVSFEGAKKDVLAAYDERITAIAVDAEGNVIDGVDGYDIDLKKEYKKDPTERKYPVFIYKHEGETAYIIPLIGLGLWDEINGYVAFEDDLNTIKGVAYDHVGETPGLGGEITKEYFQDRFVGKKAFDKDGNYALTIYKSGKSPKGVSDVDGLSGATLTTEGMDNMHRNVIPNYQKYFNTIKK